MRDINEITVYLELMLRTAISITRNRDDANEIVQRTCFVVIREIMKGKEISNLKNYLISVICNETSRFYDKEDRYEISGDFDDNFNEPFNDDILDFLENEKTNEIHMKIRRELAFLEKEFRVLFINRYIKEKSLEELSKEFNIPKSTIHDKLEKGRKIMLEGYKTSESYLEVSYDPKYLFISYGGRIGLKGEPKNIITNLIDHNILIIVAYTPRTVPEISRIMGISTVYVEESVKKLLKYGLIEKSGKNYYTNFLVLYDADLQNLQKVSKQVVEESFNKVKGIFTDLVNEFTKLAILYEYNKEQQYLYAINMICFHTQNYLINSLQLLKAEDYPEKFNMGKWLIDVGFVTDQEDTFPRSYLYMHGPSINEFYSGISLVEFDSVLGKTYRTEVSSELSHHEKVKLLSNISKKVAIDESLFPILRDFMELGFIKSGKASDYNWIPCYPMLSQTEYKNLIKICRYHAEKFISKIGKYLIEVVKNSKLDHPKWIGSNQAFLNLACLTAVPVLYAMKASESGLINITKENKYPLIILVEK